MADTPEPIRLMGVPGSPYTRKMIALLRYRRIPHAVIWGGHHAPPADLPAPKVKLLPTLWFPDGEGGYEAAVDTSPVLRRLEAEHHARAVIPADPVLAFVDRLIEDYADEWLTKAMFHFRWAHPADAEHVTPLLIYWSDPALDEDAALRFADAFAQRQIGRLGVVGSNEATAATIEHSYERLVGVLDALLAKDGCVLGRRPGSGDFALYGQLTQLAVIEPTSAALTRRLSPRLRAWVDRVEDLSGLSPQEADWTPRAELDARLRPLLSEIGRVYAPFLIANARALGDGRGTVETEIDGRAWTQAVFPYQAKCLHWIREAYAALSPRDRAAVDALLAGTGCEILLKG